jgi:hypothetical protein
MLCDGVPKPPSPVGAGVAAPNPPPKPVAAGVAAPVISGESRVRRVSRASMISMLIRFLRPIRIVYSRVLTEASQ